MLIIPKTDKVLSVDAVELGVLRDLFDWLINVGYVEKLCLVLKLVFSHFLDQFILHLDRSNFFSIGQRTDVFKQASVLACQVQD